MDLAVGLAGMTRTLEPPVARRTVVVVMGVAADLSGLVASGAVVDRRARAGTDSIAR